MVLWKQYGKTAREREGERERENHGVGRDVSFLLKQEKIRVNQRGRASLIYVNFISFSLRRLQEGLSSNNIMACSERIGFVAKNDSKKCAFLRKFQCVHLIEVWFRFLPKHKISLVKSIFLNIRPHFPFCLLDLRRWVSPAVGLSSSTSSHSIYLSLLFSYLFICHFINSSNLLPFQAHRDLFLL